MTRHEKSTSSHASSTLLSVFAIAVIATGCTDGGPTGPSEPFPATTTPEKVDAFIALVSEDTRLRLLPSFEDQALARELDRELAILDSSLLSRNRREAEASLRSARAVLDRFGSGDLSDAGAIHLGLNAAAELLGLPISAMRIVVSSR